MTTQPENRFFFLANAVALAAHIRRPQDAFLPAVASACLPVTGGVGYGESSGGQLPGVLSHGKASSKVSGDFVPPEQAADFTHGNHGQNLLAAQTRADVSLEGLQVNNGGHTIAIDSLVAGQSSYCDRTHATQFRALTAEFNNVRVDGTVLTVTTNCDLFNQNSTRQRLAESYARDQDFRTRHAHLFVAAKPVNVRRQAIPASGGIICATVVTALTWEGKAPAGVTINGNRLTIDNFGSVYFGDLMIEDEFRRLTLVRFQLGSPTGGSASAGEVQSNGSTWPPHKSGN